MGDAVRDVAEGRRALVGRDHEIGIVGIVAHHRRRMLDRAALAIVGDVEHAAHQGAVARDALVLDLGPRRRRRQRLLDDETAFRADRHDHRVLDLLGFHEPQDLGTEILAPVRPADAAARDLAAAQVDAFGLRRIHPDLDQRPRLGQLVDRLAVELEGDVRFWAAVGGRLVVVGAQG